MLKKCIFALFLLAVCSIHNSPIHSAEKFIKLGITDNPPLVYPGDDKEAQGFFIELLNEIGAMEGWQFEYEYGTLSDMLTMLTTGEIDIKPDLGFSHVRDEIYLFNEEHVLSTWAHVYVNHKNGIENILDLDGMTVAVQKGDYFVEDKYRGFRHIAAQMNLNINYIEVDNYEEVFRMLENKQADAGIVNRIFGEVHCDEYKVYQTSIIFAPVSLLYAVSPQTENADQIVSAIDKHLSEMKNDRNSVYYRLLDQYFFIEPVVLIPQWLKTLLITVSILFAVALIISLTLTVEVRAKNSELDKERRLVRKILSTAPIGLCEIGHDGSVIFANETLKKKFDDFVHWLPYREVINKRLHIHDVYSEIEKAGGDKLFVLVNGSCFMERSSNTAVFAIEDITELILSQKLRNELTQQIQEIQKVGTIGRIAAGIAHDFNNLLMIVQGNIDLSLMKIQDGEPPNEYLQEINSTINRASQLTRQMLVFSRREPYMIGKLELNRVIFEMDNMINILIGKSVTLGLELCDRALPILMNRSNLEQIIVNLVSNTKDSMPEGGTLQIITSVVEGREMKSGADDDLPMNRKALSELENIAYIRMDCRDTGEGIDPDLLPYIFDPFFTTKPEGKGTGLGLSVVRDIVQDAQGQITIQSEGGIGTTFSIFLPLFPTPQDAVQRIQDEFIGSRFNQHLRVLILAKIEAQAELVGEVLTRLGCETTTYSCEAEAIEKLSSQDLNYDLVITDYEAIEAENGGLIDRIKKSHPNGISIIICSDAGHTTRDWIKVQDKNYGYLLKPYTVPQLIRMITDSGYSLSEK